jgi:hypothetical protein
MDESAQAERLNRDCFCTTLDIAKLAGHLAGNPLANDLLNAYPRFFSKTAVFISPRQMAQMRAMASAIERVVHNAGYQAAVLAEAPAIARIDDGTSGVFMGYDFHLDDDGPQLIEINTNAGGAFLNATLVSAQTACCQAAEAVSPVLRRQLDAGFLDMFKAEWRAMRGSEPLKAIAIVDERPEQQFLYPEFLIAKQLFEQAGINALIADPSELTFQNNRLHCQGAPIDLVYNRLTDFYLSEPGNSALRHAHEAGAVLLTPSPRQHALYADKRNLELLGNAGRLAQLGVEAQDIRILSAGIPPTQTVRPDNAEQLWQTRNALFFKPATGFGSRAAYRGDKLTTRVWEQIKAGDYVAQRKIPPSERGITVDGKATRLKVDIRAYAYAGDILLMAARLYQGQTTNFRTEGGGFAPVFVAG